MFEVHKLKAAEPPEPIALEPERWLVLSIFERAIADFLAGTHEDSREAAAWLRSTNREQGSAEWYAEVAELEGILRACRAVIDNTLAVNILRLHGARRVGYGRRKSKKVLSRN